MNCKIPRSFILLLPASFHLPIIPTHVYPSPSESTASRSHRSTRVQLPLSSCPELHELACFPSLSLHSGTRRRCRHMAPSSDVNRSILSFTLAGRALSQVFTMLGLLQAVCALSLSSLLYQAEGTALPHVNKLQERYAPGHTGAVASESDICSHIGINLLQRGGNAADAVRSCSGTSENLTDML